MNVKICRADESQADEWDRIVGESSHGTIFHTWNWLSIAARYSGWTLHPLIGYAKNEPLGIFPLFSRRQFGMNLVFSPPPHVALIYLGPAILTDDVQLQSRKEKIYSSFVDGVNHYIRDELRAHYVQIFLPPKFSDPRFFTWSGYTVRPEYNYVSDVSPGAEKLYQDLPKKKRQDITRAVRRGITIEMGGIEELNEMYRLMVERYREQGRAVLVPKEYLFEIYHTFPKNVLIFIAKYENEIVSGVIDVLNRESLLSWIGNPRPLKSISPSPNDLLQWEEIQYCCNHGLTSYVTMGAAGNERLHTYYSEKLNPELDIRFSAKKCSPVAGCIESAYIHAYKPVISYLKNSWPS